MFSLVITIISIALVAALALATLYYGGRAFIVSAESAQATKVINESQQVRSALALRQSETGQVTSDLNDLVAGKYLRSLPVGWGLIDGYATKAVDNVDQCLAANSKVGVDEVPTCAALKDNPSAYGNKTLCCSFSG